MTSAMKTNAPICKKVLLPALPLLLLLTAAGCRKEVSPGEETPRFPVELTIGFGNDAGTRTGASAVLTEAEKTVQRMQLLVYAHRRGITYLEKELSLAKFSTGTDDYGQTVLTGLSPVELTAGQKTILISINGPLMEAPSVPDDFLDSGPYLISLYNSPSRYFWLFGSVSAMIDSGTSRLDLRVRRLVGRVSITGITNRLTGGQSVSSIYAFLANAPAQMNASPDPYAESYIMNPGGRVGSIPWNGVENPSVSFITGLGINTSSCSEMAQSIPEIPSGGVYTTPCYLYACAMHDAIPHSPWLILAATIDGAIFYYNIPLERFEANVNQNVSITLRSLGSPEPCIPNDPGAWTISILPNNWRAETGEETI